MLALLALALGLGSGGVTRAQVEVTATTVKAAFLYKFAGYVEWPADRDREPIGIGVMGADDFADQLAGLTRERTVSGRSIVVRTVSQADQLDDLDILFVGNRERTRLAELLAPARNRPILTVTESNEGLAAGSIINFTLDEERVRFDVALDEAERSGLRLNSRLLAVAHDVRRTRE